MEIKTTKNNSKTILVIGATGLLGEPVTKQLQKAGYLVRIFSRDYKKAKGKFDSSFEIAKGDVGVSEFVLWHDKGVCVYDTKEHNIISFQFK